MEKIFQRIVQDNFSELKGMSVDALVPVPQSLLNELIVAALKGNRSIESCQASIHEQNRVALRVKTTLLPISIDLKLKLDKSVDLASYSSPKIRAWLENNRWLASLSTLFKALPEGIKLYGDQVVIDLGVFIGKPEQRRLLQLVKSVGIQTEEGKVVLDVDIRIDEQKSQYTPT